jgi:tetratricopeptide (TPR) repeat protein
MPISINVIVLFCVFDPVYHTARDFFEAGFYDEAITEFKRYLFFNPAGESAMPAYYQMGRAYFELGQTEAAVDMAALAARAAPDDSSRAEYDLKTAVIAIAAGSYSRAEMILLQLEMSTPIPGIQERATLFRAIACLYAYKWTGAREALDEYYQHHPCPEIQSPVDSLLRTAERMKLKSPAAALWLSTFLPGTGQMYAGEWREGLNALVLNGGFAVWVGYKLLNQYWDDAYLISSFLWQRYYFGNRYHARRLTEEKNDQTRRHTAQKVIDLLRTP